MLSYLSDPKIKAACLARMQGHATTEEKPIRKVLGRRQGHLLHEVELGIPVALAPLENCILEGCRTRQRKGFPTRLSVAKGNEVLTEDLSPSASQVDLSGLQGFLSLGRTKGTDAAERDLNIATPREPPT
jgi:hypothetical protein